MTKLEDLAKRVDAIGNDTTSETREHDRVMFVEGYAHGMMASEKCLPLLTEGARPLLVEALNEARWAADIERGLRATPFRDGYMQAVREVTDRLPVEIQHEVIEALKRRNELKEGFNSGHRISACKLG